MKNCILAFGFACLYVSLATKSTRLYPCNHCLQFGIWSQFWSWHKLSEKLIFFSVSECLGPMCELVAGTSRFFSKCALLLFSFFMVVGIRRTERYSI